MNLRSGNRDVALHGASLVLLVLSMVGCASMTPRPAEQVFLYQSRIADALLDRYPVLDVFSAADPKLVAAEARMIEACGPLTEAVVSRLEGREPPLMLRLQVMYTTDECERAAQRIEHLLRVADSRAAAGEPSI